MPKPTFEEIMTAMKTLKDCDEVATAFGEAQPACDTLALRTYVFNHPDPVMVALIITYLADKGIPFDDVMQKSLAGKEMPTTDFLSVMMNTLYLDHNAASEAQRASIISVLYQYFSMIEHTEAIRDKINTRLGRGDIASVFDLTARDFITAFDKVAYQLQHQKLHRTQSTFFSAAAEENDGIQAPPPSRKGEDDEPEHMAMDTQDVVDEHKNSPLSFLGRRDSFS